MYLSVLFSHRKEEPLKWNTDLFHQCALIRKSVGGFLFFMVACHTVYVTTARKKQTVRRQPFMPACLIYILIEIEQTESQWLRFTVNAK